METSYNAGNISNSSGTLLLFNADNSDYTDFSCANISTNGHNIYLNNSTGGCGNMSGVSDITFLSSNINLGKIGYDSTHADDLTISSNDYIYMQFTNDNSNIIFSQGGNINCGTIAASGNINCGTISASGNITNSGVLNVNGTIYNQLFNISTDNTWGNGREWGGYNGSGDYTGYDTNNHTYTINYSIGCPSNVVSTGGSFIAFSDKRTKMNVSELKSFDSLNIIRKIKPIEYEYIDQKDNKKFGFIAQDLKESIPTAISLNTNYIPNIYEIVKVTNKTTIQLDNKSKQDFDLKYKIIKLKFYIIDCSGQIKKELFGTIKEFIDDKSFTINEEIDEQFLVLYGQEVNDILGLDYNQTNIINISAVKQIDLELQETKETVVKQQQQIDSQKQQIDNQKQQIDHLTAEIAALKELIMGRIGQLPT